MSTKLRKGDLVEVIAGDYTKENIGKYDGEQDGPKRASRGRIISIDRKAGKVVVEGVNFKWNHEKVRPVEGGGYEGGRVAREAPIDISNVAIVDPKTDKPARLGAKVVGGKKVRVARNKENREGTVLE